MPTPSNCFSDCHQALNTMLRLQNAYRSIQHRHDVTAIQNIRSRVDEPRLRLNALSPRGFLVSRLRFSNLSSRGTKSQSQCEGVLCVRVRQHFCSRDCLSSCELGHVEGVSQRVVSLLRESGLPRSVCRPFVSLTYYQENYKSNIDLFKKPNEVSAVTRESVRP